jgi:hypothetical protein
MASALLPDSVGEEVLLHRFPLRALLQNRPIRIAALLLAGLLGWVLGRAYLIGHEGIVVTVDVEADKGHMIEVFYGDNWLGNVPRPMHPGRDTYRFEGLPAKTNAFRFDPTDDGDSHVRIYSMTFWSGTRALQTLGAADFRNWALINANKIDDPASFQFVSTNHDPIMVSPSGYDFQSAAGWRASSVGAHLTGENIAIALAVLFLLLSGWKGRLVEAQLPALVLLVIVALRPLTNWIGYRLGGVQSPEEAIGWANYHGYPKSGEFALFMFACALAAIAGAGAGVLFRRRHPPLQGHPHAPQGHVRVWPIVALLAAYCLVAFPPLASIVGAYKTAVHDPGYDWGNVFTWDYFVHRGWVPLKDFWYPYGGFFAFETLPGGYVESYAHLCIVLAVFTVAVWRLTGRSWPWTLGILAVTLAAIRAVLFWGANRYLLSVDVVLLGLVLAQENYSPRETVPVAVMALYAFIFDQFQVPYAALPLAVVYALDLLHPPPGSDRRKVARGVLALIAASAVLLGSNLVVLAVQGRLRGLWGLALEMKAASIYCASASLLTTWFDFKLDTAHLLLWGILFLVSYGFALRLASDSTDTRRASAICIALGLAGAFTFNKQILRMDISRQLLCYVAIGVMLCACQLAPRIRVRQVASLVFALGFTLATAFDAWGSFRNLAAEMQARLSSLPGDLAVLRSDRSTLQAIEDDYYENESRYPRYTAVIRRLKQLRGAQAGEEPHVYVLGDDSLIYIALRQRPPYYITVYNESPYDAQRRIVDWIETNRPEFVVWRAAAREFDDVPHLVRAPLVFDDVIEHYEPLETVGEFEILRRRASGRPFNLDFWRSLLGSSLDLKALPSISPLAKASTCHEEPGCVEVLKVAIADPHAGQTVTLPISAGGQEFRLSLDQRAGVSTYYVNLHWIWFWGQLKRIGVWPALARDVPGVQVELEGRTSTTTHLF